IFDYPNVRQLSAALASERKGAEPVAAAAPLAANADEAIAIVGMGCRLPGGADSPDKYWQLLREGRDAITPVPDGRWGALTFYDPTGEDPHKSYTIEGGFVGDLAEFDASLFGISAAEAENMDPQQRLVLEATWQALEHAQLPPERVAGSKTGV